MAEVNQDKPNDAMVILCVNERGAISGEDKLQKALEDGYHIMDVIQTPTSTHNPSTDTKVAPFV